jgi:hypothetical protein
MAAELASGATILIAGPDRQPAPFSGGWRSTPIRWRPLNQPIRFTCRHCATRYLAVRTESPVERTYRLYCHVCRDLLHDDTGFYNLSELAMIVDDGVDYRQEAERCRSLAAKAVDPVERDALQRIADEWLKLARLPK